MRRDPVELGLEAVVVEVARVQVRAPAHRVLGHQCRLVDFLVGGAEELGRLRVEVDAIAATSRARDGQPDQLLVLVRDGGLGELELLEARSLCLDHGVRDLREELGHEPKRLSDV